MATARRSGAAVWPGGHGESAVQRSAPLGAVSAFIEQMEDGLAGSGRGFACEVVRAGDRPLVWRLTGGPRECGRQRSGARSSARDRSRLAPIRAVGHAGRKAEGAGAAIGPLRPWINWAKGERRGKRAAVVFGPGKEGRGPGCARGR
ncbi:hypothetical protein E2562_023403 [Oryza meyeriana var. granulata]|uniref:Uncharacterized protein n=1 Tax=Oryza meyeriana var. granulata TaxID=110450 RepID=A0A6G1E1G9_9ORYZ|nr:hypothetical protein E2562_023403 [Oryza meyeriana var. granulata]